MHTHTSRLRPPTSRLTKNRVRQDTAFGDNVDMCLCVCLGVGREGEGGQKKDAVVLKVGGTPPRMAQSYGSEGLCPLRALM